jgi:hypothetical protein
VEHLLLCPGIEATVTTRGETYVATAYRVFFELVIINTPKIDNTR